MGLRARPERTFESLYRRHAAAVYRYALVMLDSPADAEDVTQTTFLNAYRALLRGERPRAPGSWLRTIAHNLCLQHFRQAARRAPEVELEADAVDLVSDEPGVGVDDLVRALRQIPAKQRAALVMRELEGRPLAEIAGVLAVTPSAVETLLFRARRSMREQLEGNLTCAQAERAISRQLDGTLPRNKRGALRAHVRQCEECAHLARSLRAQRGAIRSLAAVPLPGALAWSKFGTGAAVSSVASATAGTATTGGAWLAGSLAAKLAGATLIAAVAAGVSYDVAVRQPWTTNGPAAKHRVDAHATASSDSTTERAGPLTALTFAAIRAVDPRNAVLARGAARATPTVRPGANAETITPKAAALPTRSSPSLRTSHTGVGDPPKGAGVGRSRGLRPTHAARPRPITHPPKPTHPRKPTHPPKQSHPRKSTHPPKPSHRPKPTHPPVLSRPKHQASKQARVRLSV